MRRSSKSSQEKKKNKHLSRLAAAVTAVRLGISSLLLGVTAANAANQVVIDNVEFVNGTTKDPITGIEDGTRQDLKIDMSVPGPGPAVAPVTGTIYLDERLKATPQKIDIIGENGEKAGFCLVSETKLECSLFDEYVEQHPYDLQATVYFNTWVQAGNSEEEDLQFTVGNTVTRPVEVTPSTPGEPCTTTCEYEGTNGAKIGYWDYDATTTETYLQWIVVVPAGPDGTIPGSAVEVTETIDLNQFEMLPGTQKFVRITPCTSMMMETRAPFIGRCSMRVNLPLQRIDSQSISPQKLVEPRT